MYPTPEECQLVVVYAAQPREGTETRAELAGIHRIRHQVYAAQPREGTETIHCLLNYLAVYLKTVYAAQPREGTETSRQSSREISSYSVGLCSSTPRGDGNFRCACTFR